MELRKQIIEAVNKAQRKEIFSEEIYSNTNTDGANEFLFFIKPEITIDNPDIKFDAILDMILGKISDHGLALKNVKVLSAAYLKEYNIIAQHYGVINQIANNAIAAMSDSAKATFKEKFDKNIEDCDVYGGLEFLKRYPVFNADSLEYLWQNQKNTKLAGGTYIVRLSLDGQEVFVVNGFHPKQLLHFTDDGRSIVTFTLVGDLDWETARQDLIGATAPSAAKAGSIRRTLLDNKSGYGLPDVSQGSNGVHLSAGPIEGLVELVRYNSDFSQTDKALSFASFSLGKQLQQKYSDAQIEKILSNPNVEQSGQQISVFDLTEEKNASEVLEILQEFNFE